MSGIGKFIDSTLDSLVVPGFSRIGYAVRSTQFVPLSQYSLAGKTVVITGPTSGLGQAAAYQLASMGADIVLVGRSAEKLTIINDALNTNFPSGKFVSVVADMGVLASVKEAAQKICEIAPSIHALVNNAGALLNERAVSPEGHEVTVASHVLGPHLLTTLLLPTLTASGGRVITVSSGGMYGAVIPDIAKGQSPEMSVEAYGGSKQYAIAKRLQVTLNEIWPTRCTGVTFATMHPGWADTPGVQESLPAFRTATKPLLRTPAQGADTISWLVADDAVLANSGKFWSDRAVRPIHKLTRTRRSDTPEVRDALWTWCNEQIAPLVLQPE